MKLTIKHMAFSVSVVMMLSSLGSITLVGMRFPQIFGVKPSPAANTAIPVLSPELLQDSKRLRPEMERLRLQLAALRNPTLTESTPVNLMAMGFSQRAVESQSETSRSTTEDFSERVVTMAYVSSSGEERFAVIDDRLYREGDRLAKMEGATVRTITPHKVLIAGKEVRQWLEVRNPMALDILTKQQEKERQRLAKQAAKAEKKTAKGEEPTDNSQSADNQLDDAITALKGFSDLINQGRRQQQER